MTNAKHASIAFSNTWALHAGARVRALAVLGCGLSCLGQAAWAQSAAIDAAGAAPSVHPAAQTGSPTLSHVAMPEVPVLVEALAAPAPLPAAEAVPAAVQELLRPAAAASPMAPAEVEAAAPLAVDSAQWAQAHALPLPQEAASEPAPVRHTWFFVDDKGVLHYANQKLDERYHRFSMNDLAPDDGPLFVDIRRQAETLALATQRDSAAAERFFSRHSGYLLHRKHIDAAAQKHGVDADLLKAIATAESGFNATAVSPKGAIGLMQVIPDTAARFGVAGDTKRSIAQKLKDPSINVPVSARYVRYLQGMFPGRTDLVLAAYNAGEGAVQRYGNKIPPYKETQNYVKTVMSLYQGMQPQAGKQRNNQRQRAAQSDSSSTLLGLSPTGSGRLRATMAGPSGPTEP